MNGRGHVTTTAVVVTAGAACVLRQPVEVAVCAGVATGAAALLPDLDQHHSTAARSLGLVSRLFARFIVMPWAVRHRWRTHDAGVGPAVFAAATFVLMLTAPGRAVLVAVTTGLVMAAFTAARVIRSTGTLRFVCAVCVAWGTWGLEPVPAWTAAALVWVGCVAHILQDAGTRAGVPAPFTTIGRTRP